MFCLQVFPPTFKLAFAGKESWLTEKLDVSHSGILTKLMDKQIIRRKHRQLIEVSL